MNILEILQNLAGQTGFANLTWGNYLMIAVALFFNVSTDYLLGLTDL